MRPLSLYLACGFALAGTLLSQEAPPDLGDPINIGDQPGETAPPTEPGDQPGSEAASPVVARGKEAKNGEQKSMVRVNVTSQPYNPRVPWQRFPPQSRAGLGVLIEPGKILVAAMLVADATFVELEQPLSGRKITGKVLHVDYESNFAIVTPLKESPDFFAAMQPMPLAEELKVGDSLEVCQLERNGKTLTNSTVVTQFDVVPYVVDGGVFIVCQATGPLQSAASTFGAPVVREGKLAGLLLRYDAKDQTTNIQPISLIRHFLTDCQDGKYDGFPNLGIETAQTLDPQFRKYLGLKDEDGGVYVSRIISGSSALNLGLKLGDVILEVSGQKVDSRGNYEDPAFGTLPLGNLIRGKAFVGDKLKAVVLRGGQRVELEGALIRKAVKDYLIEPYLIDRAPRYLITGGFIFQELSLPFLRSLRSAGEGDGPTKLFFIASKPELFEKEVRKIVFISAVLPSSASQGYENLPGAIVTKANGEAVKDLNDLSKALEKPRDGVQTIELDDYPNFIHLDAELAKQEDEGEIRQKFRIPKLSQLN